MDFIAVDFETPNGNNDCICAMGLTFVQNSEVMFSRGFLLNPHANFDTHNTAVHGITRDMVKDAPDFAAVWPEYRRYFAHYPIAAHNANFDASVLEKQAKRSHVELPRMDWLCTMRLTEANTGIKQPSLEAACAHFGIEQSAVHDGGSCSYCAALVMLALAKDENAELYVTRQTPNPKPMSEAKPSGNGTHSKESYMSGAEKVRPEIAYDLAPIRFEGNTFVVTGDVAEFSQEETEGMIRERGGIVQSGVRQDTRYLIVGMQKAEKPITGKMERALAMREKGAKIELVAYDRFLNETGV